MKGPFVPSTFVFAALAAPAVLGAAVAAFAREAPILVAAAPPGRGSVVRDAPPKPPLPPCLLPQGDPLPAQKIMQELAAGRSVELQGRIIDGSLEADAIGPSGDDRRTSLRIVPGRLKLDACRINGRVAMPRAILPQDLVLTCTEIVGDVDLSDSYVQGGVNLERSKIVGDVRLAHATIDRDVSLKGATVEGSIEASGGRAGGLLLSGADVHRDLGVSREVLQSLDLNTGQVAGAVKLEDVLVVNFLMAREAKIGRAFVLDGVRVANLADFSASAPAGGISATNFTVDASLMLSLSGDFSISLQDVSVGQNLMMVDGTYGEVRMERLRVRAGSELQGSRFTRKVFVTDADFGERFSAELARFEGETEFRTTRFAGQDPMAGALFASSPVLVDTVLPVPPTLIGDESADDDEGDDTGDDEEEEGGDGPDGGGS